MQTHLEAYSNQAEGVVPFDQVLALQVHQDQGEDLLEDLGLEGELGKAAK